MEEGKKKKAPRNKRDRKRKRIGKKEENLAEMESSGKEGRKGDRVGGKERRERRTEAGKYSGK